MSTAAPAMVRIKNNCARLIHLPDSVRNVRDEDGKDRVQIAAQGRQIAPGLSEPFPADELATARKNKGFAGFFVAKVARGENQGRPWLEVSSDLDAPAGVEAPETLAGYQIGGAVAFVETCSDPAVLARWGADTRVEVKTAITKRLGVLAAQAPAKK